MSNPANLILSADPILHRCIAPRLGGNVICGCSPGRCAELEYWQEQEDADCLSPKGDAAWQERG